MDTTKSIEAGGGVVYIRDKHYVKVLMIHRRGVWDLPKGKIEPHESVENGAMREVNEETGCDDLRVSFPLGITEHSYNDNGRQLQKRTWWFAMESGRPELQPQISEQIDALEWVEINEAINKANFHNLKKVLQRFSNEVSQRT